MLVDIEKLYAIKKSPPEYKICIFKFLFYTTILNK